jgi:hypothetical protein
MELRRCQHRGVLSGTLSGRGQSFGVVTKGCVLMLDLIFSADNASGGGPAATVFPA